MKSITEPAYWNERYLRQDIPWDIGKAAPPLVHFIDSLRDKSLRILIPGAGHAHEAVYLIENGFDRVFICDWAPEAFGAIRKMLPGFPPEQLLVGDFFKLSMEVDLILEQTFFCAIPPVRRTDYARKCHELLAEDGEVAGLLFASEFSFEGPPYGGEKATYEAIFQPYFNILKMEIANNSIAPRQGNELFFHLRKLSK